MSKKVITESENVNSTEINELIVVKQLPVIEEQLKLIKTEIETKVSGVLALKCTADTVKAIKVLRADLTKDFNELEDRRKIVKKKVLEPYEAFEKVYKECVTTIFKSADDELKKRVDIVEDSLREQKRQKIEDYFNEYLLSKNIDFIKFEDAKINVTLSAAEKGLLEQAKAFIDRICDDLKLIDTQDYKEEILVEYKSSLNVSNSITTVCERHKAIDAEKAKQEQAEQIKQEQQETIEKVEKAVPTGTVILTPPKTADDKVFKMTFTVVAKKTKLQELKRFLENGEYEIIKK